MMSDLSTTVASLCHPRVHRDIAQVTLPPGTVVAIGNYDGVHRGHQAVLSRATALAKEIPGEHQVAVLTFDPHPAKVLAPTLAPALICTMDRRVELLGEAGAQHVVIATFGRELASLEAQAFVEEILVRHLGAAGVVVGYDFTFGARRRGTVEVLQAAGDVHGFRVLVAPPYHQDGILVSSTKIREFILAGRVLGASILLGRPFELSGPVVRGAGRGRTIGYPTANVAFREEILPAFGVYAARARVGEAPQEQSVDAAVSIGIVPTFKQSREVTVEAYLLDFKEDIYEKPVVLELVKRLRPERRFESVEALVRQIGLDVRQVRDILLTL